LFTVYILTIDILAMPNIEMRIRNEGKKKQGLDF